MIAHIPPDWWLVTAMLVLIAVLATVILMCPDGDE